MIFLNFNQSHQVWCNIFLTNHTRFHCTIHLGVIFLNLNQSHQVWCNKLLTNHTNFRAKQVFWSRHDMLSKFISCLGKTVGKLSPHFLLLFWSQWVVLQAWFAFLFRSRLVWYKRLNHTRRDLRKNCKSCLMIKYYFTNRRDINNT